jgi:hypothetical protein
VVAGLGVALALPHLTAQRTVVSYPAAALDPATALRHE